MESILPSGLKTIKLPVHLKYPIAALLVGLLLLVGGCLPAEPARGEEFLALTTGPDTLLAAPSPTPTPESLLPTAPAALIQPSPPVVEEARPTPTPEASLLPQASPAPLQTATPAQPAPELTYYTVQPGDTLAAIRRRFGGAEILASCPQAGPGCGQSLGAAPQAGAGLLAPGQMLVLAVPPSGVYMPWLLPDSEVVYSPGTAAFDTLEYVARAGGFMQSYEQYLMLTGPSTGAEIIQRVAVENSINPRLLLALLEFQCQCIRGHAEDSQPALGTTPVPFLKAYSHHRADLYGQLTWAVMRLSEGYYGWREGTLTSIQFSDGTIIDVEPTLNAGTVALMHLFANLYPPETWQQALDPQNGFPAVYTEMFGSPWALAVPLFAGDVQQPPLQLPFEPGKVWGFTGGPHPAWEGSGPLAALDFAPPAETDGCFESPEWVVAMADGVVVRSEYGVVVQDLDGDGLEHTGWNLVYLHLDRYTMAALGTELKTGDRIGHPSCDGGRSTGTHLHIARKYNGEWIAADGPLPLNLSGWVAHDGPQAYLGTLEKNGQVVTACVCSGRDSLIGWDR